MSPAKISVDVANPVLASPPVVSDVSVAVEDAEPRPVELRLLEPRAIDEVRVSASGVAATVPG